MSSISPYIDPANLAAIAGLNAANLIDMAELIAYADDVGVRVDDYDAAGDGTANDTVPINNAITAAGAGGIVVFTPGKTYLHYAGLQPLANQVFVGYGATLKRGNQITTTITADLTAPTNQITVASTTGLAVGMSIQVFSGTTYDVTTQHRITDITGSVVTVGNNFTQSLSSGASVVTSFHQMNAEGGSPATGWQVYGLTFDGNRANNTAFQRWDQHSSLILAGNCRAVNCTIINAQADALFVTGSTPKVTDVRIENSSGNGIHLSAASGVSITGASIVNSNLDGATPGHEDGAIGWSNLISEVHIANCFIDTATSGFGGIDSNDNDKIVITNCTVKDCDRVIEADGTNNNLNMQVSNCLFIDSVELYVNNMDRWSVSGCRFENTIIKALNSDYIQIQGNTFVQDAAAQFSIDVNNCDHLVVRGNTFECYTGSSAGVLLRQICQMFDVSGNKIHGANWGIFLDSSDHLDGLISNNILTGIVTTGIFHQGLRTKISGNYIQGGGASWYGIRFTSTDHNVEVSGNTIKSSSSLYGVLCPNGSSTEAGAYVINNVVRVGSGSSITAGGGTENNYVINNLCNVAPVNSGTNTFSGNTLIVD